MTVYFAVRIFTRNVFGKRGWFDQVRLGLIEFTTLETRQ
jgi:hypothetical protein